MGIRRTFTRDDMRAFLTILKEQLKVEYSTRNLSNVTKCKTAIKDIVDIYADRKLKEYFAGKKEKSIKLQILFQKTLSLSINLWLKKNFYILKIYFSELK